MAEKYIIDLSEFNQVTDFAQVAKNVSLIIFRVGYRYSVDASIKYDAKYHEYLSAVKQYKIPFSFYFVSQATTDLEARQEALFVAQECKDHIETYYVPVFVDTEKINGHSRGDVMTKTQRTACIKTFCDTLQQQGIPAGIYSNLNWLNTALDMSKLPYTVWMAEYGEKDTYTGAHLLWQYTSKGSVPGISGNVDISKMVNKEATKTKKTVTAPVVSQEAQKIITVEKRELGYLEKKSNLHLDNKTANAGSANYTKYWRDLYPAFQGQPWCAAFQCWSFVKALGTARAKELLLGNYTYYCPTLVNRYKKANQWYASPKVGDLIFFKNKSGEAAHVGYVVDIDTSKHYVHTIEGNTSSSAGVVANGGGVFAKSYPLSYYRILGYGRPKYASAAEYKTQKPASVEDTLKVADAKFYNKNIAGTYRVTASKLNMRTNAGTQYPVIAVLTKDNQVNNYGFYSKDNDGKEWLYVKVGKYTGYVMSMWLARI